MARGINSVVRIKVQSGLNTAATFSAADKVEITPFTGETFKASVTQVASQALRRIGERQKKLTRLGTLDVSGGITIEPTNNALHNLLPLLTGPDGVILDTATAAPSYNKAYVMTSTDAPYATVIVDDGDITRAYANMRLSTFGLSAAMNQLGSLSLDFVGTHFKTNGTNAGIAWDQGVSGTVPQPGLAYAAASVEYGLYFDQATLQVGLSGGSTVEIPVTDFSLSVNKNTNGERWKLGSRFRREVTTGVADVTGSFTLDANYNPNGGGINSKDWAYQAIQNSTYLALRFTFSDPTNTMELGATKVVTNSELTVILPYIYIDSPDWNISGDDIVTGAINFTSYADGANGLRIEHKYKLDA